MPAEWKVGLPWQREVSRDQALELLEQLESLLAAGLPLDRALHILTGAVESPAQKRLTQSLLLDIEKGRTLAQALANHPRQFTVLVVNMVRAGEEGGILPIVLKRMIDYYLARRDFRRFLVTSSIYPLTLLVFGILALGGILLFVLPKFTEAYADLAASNGSAAFLIGLSDGIQTHGVTVLAAVLLLAAALTLWVKTPRGRAGLQASLLRTPFFGRIILESDMARILHTLGVLLGAGVPILPALRLSRSLTVFARIEDAFEEVERHLREGRGVARPMLANPLFPRIIGQMAVVGEESGTLDKMLVKVGQRMENRVRDRLRAFMAILEPALIVTIGLVIGVVVVSMIAAIFSLNELPV